MNAILLGRIHSPGTVAPGYAGAATNTAGAISTEPQAFVAAYSLADGACNGE
jgi:hypothetical protein